MKRFTYIGILFVAAWGLVGGCDPKFEPIDREKGQYSVYGGLDIRKDTNFIRVKDLNVPLADDTLQQLGAVVTLRNMREGIAQELTDSIVTIEGARLHNFRTTLPINPQTPYLLTVSPPGREGVQALATTPAIASTRLTPGSGIGCRTDFQLIFDPVDPTAGIDLDIEFEFLFEKFTLRTPTRNYIRYENNRAILEISPYLVLQLVPDLPAIPSRTLCDQLTSDIFTVSYYHFGPGFRSSTTSDSLDIPGGTAEFFGFYRDTLTIELQLEP